LQSVAINLSPPSSTSDTYIQPKNLDINAKLYSTKHYSWPTLLDFKLSSLRCKIDLLGHGVSSEDGLPSSNFIKRTDYSLTEVAIDEVKCSSLISSGINVYLDKTEYSNFRAVIWDFISMSILSLNPEQSPEVNVDCSFDFSIVSKIDFNILAFEIESPKIPINYRLALEIPLDFAISLPENKGSPSEYQSGNQDNQPLRTTSATTANTTRSNNSSFAMRPSFKINMTHSIVRMINDYCGQVIVISGPISFGFNMNYFTQYTFTTESIFFDSAKGENSIYYNTTVNSNFMQHSFRAAKTFLSGGNISTVANFGSDGFLENFIGRHR
jgi:hypothetical protein